MCNCINCSFTVSHSHFEWKLKSCLICIQFLQRVLRISWKQMVNISTGLQGISMLQLQNAPCLLGTKHHLEMCSTDYKKVSFSHSVHSSLRTARLNQKSSINFFFVTTCDCAAIGNEFVPTHSRSSTALCQSWFNGPAASLFYLGECVKLTTEGS